MSNLERFFRDVASAIIGPAEKRFARDIAAELGVRMNQDDKQPKQPPTEPEKNCNGKD